MGSIGAFGKSDAYELSSLEKSGDKRAFLNATTNRSVGRLAKSARFKERAESLAAPAAFADNAALAEGADFAACLLYTSAAAAATPCVVLGGRRII